MVDFSQKLNVRKIEFSSLGIIAVYLVVASLWIAGSDHLLAWMTSDPQRLTWYQTIKGWLFVVATAVLFFVLIRRQMIAQWIELEGSRVTLDLAPVGVAHVALNGRCIRANTALCRFLGYTEDELGGMNFESLTYGDIPESELSELDRLLSGDADSFTIEKRYLRKNGEIVWGEQSVALAREREGEPLYFIYLISDIDRRKKTEQELHESERRYRELFEKNPHPMWLFDRKTLRFLAVNDAAILHYGYSKEEFLSLTIADIRPPEDVPALGQVIGRKEGVDHSGVWRHCKKDGTIIFVEIVTHGLDFDSRPAEMVLAHDVTEVRRAHMELKKNEGMLKSLNRVLRVLSKGNETLVRARDEQNLFDGICEILVTIGGYRFSSIGLADGDSPGEIQLRAIHGVQAERTGEFQALLIGLGDKLSPSMQALQSGEVVVVQSLESDPRYAHLKKVACQFEVKGTISLPLEYRGERLGVLTIYSSRAGEFDPEEIKLLNELAEDVGYGIVSLRTERARLLAEKGLYLRHRAIEASSNAIMICDIGSDKMAIDYVNPAFESITGYGAQSVSGRHPDFLAGTDRQQKGLTDLREAVGLGHSNEAVVRFYRRSGDMFWGEVSASPVFDENDRISHYVIVINDITDRKRYEEQLEHQSNHDDLTDLPNRNLLQDRLSQSLVYAERSKRIIAVMLLDLDRFKLVNDSLGHRHGDELLSLVAERLVVSMLPGDTVARLGGNEFVISLVDVDDVADVSHFVRKVQQSLSRPVTLGDHELQVTVSIGISLSPRDGTDGETLIRNADIAMHRAKKKGGDAFVYFAPEMNMRSMEVLEMETDLRRALDRREFVLHFQPKVDLETGKIIGSEALVRWRHPGKGMIPPGSFIPLAEEIGLIVPLGLWVLEEACRCNRRWHLAGLDPGTVSVNLSARQFREADLPATIEQALQKSGMTAQLLDLELTESMVMDDPQGAVETMERLKALGLCLSLDDFGTGYSSLNYLRRFPVDTLKIDRSFIVDAVDSPTGASVTTSVIALAHSLHLTAIAEGVETDEQLEFLKNCHCDSCQGYLFSKPVPAEEFETLLRRGGQMEM